MKIAIATDIWLPLVTRVVSTLQQLQKHLVSLGHEVLLLHPNLQNKSSLRSTTLAQQLDAFNPDAIHLATEGRLGWLVRNYCMQRGYAFSTSFHSNWPDQMKSSYHLPLQWGYAWLRFFHRASSAVMVPLNPVLHTLEQHGFRHLRSWTYAVDNHSFSFNQTPSIHPHGGSMVRPVSLFVGHIDADSNLEAFLTLDIPGTKVICGDGPLVKSLRYRYPAVRWMGSVAQEQLVQWYGAADVVVLPTLQSRFSLVMLEAMSSGVPVVVYPTLAAKEILGTPAQGGAAHDDLQTAWFKALAVPRHQARSRALAFSWQYAVLMFLHHLVKKCGHTHTQVKPYLASIVINMSSKS